MSSIAGQTEKIRIRLSTDLVYYLDNCMREHKLESCSEVIASALGAMRERELETAYTAASQEWDGSEDAKLWDNALDDGL
jgi:Arc/MetJ-type ribon-helix-helix transcriptional regulator